MYLARLPNHRSYFVCVLHNIFERQRMIKNSFLRSSENLRAEYAGLTNKCMADAVDRFTSCSMGNNIADTFHKKMKATTGSMAHTEGAAKKARQQLIHDHSFWITSTSFYDHPCR